MGRLKKIMGVYGDEGGEGVGVSGLGYMGCTLFLMREKREMSFRMSELCLVRERERERERGERGRER